MQYNDWQKGKQTAARMRNRSGEMESSAVVEEGKVSGGRVCQCMCPGSERRARIPRTAGIFLLCWEEKGHFKFVSLGRRDVGITAKEWKGSRKEEQLGCIPNAPRA